jgi:lipid-binding SYLF domain-containing protein
MDILDHGMMNHYLIHYDRGRHHGHAWAVALKDKFVRKKEVIMKSRRCSYQIATGLFIGILVFAFSVLVSPVWANDAKTSLQLVDKARMAFGNFMSAKEMDAFRSLLKDAKGVFIAPQILKGAFVVGAAGGSGVFVVRDSKTGRWTGPAFYTIGEASFGFQAGGEASEVVLLAMTDRGVTALLGTSVKLGADVGIAAGPVGIGAAASTANLSADIVSFASSKGLFGGIALDGAIVKVRNGLNNAYYHKKKVSPADILVKKAVTNAHSAGLLEAVSKGAGEK